jgi:hypothetical protein
VFFHQNVLIIGNWYPLLRGKQGYFSSCILMGFAALPRIMAWSPRRVIFDFWSEFLLATRAYFLGTEPTSAIDYSDVETGRITLLN